MTVRHRYFDRSALSFSHVVDGPVDGLLKRAAPGVHSVRLRNDYRVRNFQREDCL
jgi:hypothetical protein